MRKSHTIMGFAAGFASLGLAVACSGEIPTTSSTGAGHLHAGGPALAASAPQAVRDKIVELRQWSASFHNLEAAAAAGYTTSIGCIDETAIGVDPSVARGMGFHVGGGADGLAYVDGNINVDQPEFLVYAPNQPGAGLENARLVGFDYFKPDPSEDNTGQPPPLLGNEFVYSPAFDGWMAHIYLWGNNPEGMFENWNAAVSLCSAG